MIDPTQITNYYLNNYQLEEVILFWVCAAGKNGVTSARCLDKLLCKWQPFAKTQSPFEIISCINAHANLPEELRMAGIGCYNNKAKTFISLASKQLNLKNCTVEELESIPGIGPKTARCFLIHSRENQNYAGLDTHVLKFLRDKGHTVPKSTPTGKKYRELEQIFLGYVKESGKSVADFDLLIWNDYRTRTRKR